MASSLDDSDNKTAQIRSIYSTVLEAQPSCLEWSKEWPDICVVGTYDLTESAEQQRGSQSRRGGIMTFRCEQTTQRAVSSSSAVLDLHFSPHRQQRSDSAAEILAVARSTGGVDVYHMNGDNLIDMKRLEKIQVCNPSILVLSLAWHPSPQKPTVLALSLSDGKVSLIDYGKKPCVIHTLQAHPLEAWTISWSCKTDALGRHNLYSGGDDSGLGVLSADQLDLGYSTDMVDDQASGFQVITRLNTKLHGAGVTAILPLVSQNDPIQEILLTGSYDEYVRVLAINMQGVWKVLAEKRLGGGVWRLKVISKSHVASHESGSKTSYYVLASCMHAGTRVLEICSHAMDSWTIKIISAFEEHESMNYGSDSSDYGLLKNSPKRNQVPVVVASTSFYDRKLCIWSILI